MLTFLVVQISASNWKISSRLQLQTLTLNFNLKLQIQTLTSIFNFILHLKSSTSNFKIKFCIQTLVPSVTSAMAKLGLAHVQLVLTTPKSKSKVQVYN